MATSMNNIIYYGETKDLKGGKRPKVQKIQWTKDIIQRQMSKSN